MPALCLMLQIQQNYAGIIRKTLPETACHEKIVLKIKSIVMRTTNNLFRKVHNYTRFKG